MKRIGLIVLCLLVVGVVGDTAAASVHYQAHIAQRHKLCPKHKKHSKGCRNRKQRSVSQTSGELSAPTVQPLPPLADLIAPETACPGQSDQSLPPAAQEATMGCMVNFARGKASGADLAEVATLENSSGDKAGDIIQCDEFSHTACGRPFTYWLEQDGYLQPGGCQQAGENIAWGTGDLGTVRSILTAWVHSPDHLANMLSASYDQFGVGLEVGPLSGYPDAHVWVTHFGSHC